MDKAIGFIGAGAMGGALIAGLVTRGLVSPSKIFAFDINPERLEVLSRDFGIQKVTSGQEVLEASSVVVLAVKPQSLPAAVEDLEFSPSQLIISVAAGVSLRRLEELLGTGMAVIRAMPNTPALIGEGMSVLAANKWVSAEQKELALKFFSSVGKAMFLPEEHLDAVTALSGSGPAYAYLVVEALADGGVRCGLPRDVALELAAQTLRGAASMVLRTGEHPAVLKDRVASPGGTTIAALEVLERWGVRGAFIEAVRRATERAKELSGDGHS